MCVGLALVAVSVSWVSTAAKRTKLKYQGKTINYWFKKLPVTSFATEAGPRYFRATQAWKMGQEYGSPVDSSDWESAFKAFDTNAVPFLMKKLTAKDGIAERATIRLLTKLGAKKFPFRDAGLERGQAVSGLLLFNQLPQDVERRLLSLSTNRDFEIALTATSILRAEKSGLPERPISSGRQRRSMGPRGKRL